MTYVLVVASWSDCAGVISEVLGCNYVVWLSIELVLLWLQLLILFWAAIWMLRFGANCCDCCMLNFSYDWNYFLLFLSLNELNSSIEVWSFTIHFINVILFCFMGWVDWKLIGYFGLGHCWWYVASLNALSVGTVC